MLPIASAWTYVPTINLGRIGNLSHEFPFMFLQAPLGLFSIIDATRDPVAYVFEPGIDEDYKQVIRNKEELIIPGTISMYTYELELFYCSDRSVEVDAEFDFSPPTCENLTTSSYFFVVSLVSNNPFRYYQSGVSGNYLILSLLSNLDLFILPENDAVTEFGMNLALALLAEVGGDNFKLPDFTYIEKTGILEAIKKTAPKVASSLDDARTVRIKNLVKDARIQLKIKNSKNNESDQPRFHGLKASDILRNPEIIETYPVADVINDTGLQNIAKISIEDGLLTIKLEGFYLDRRVENLFDVVPHFKIIGKSGGQLLHKIEV